MESPLGHATKTGEEMKPGGGRSAIKVLRWNHHSSGWGPPPLFPTPLLSSFWPLRPRLCETSVSLRQRDPASLQQTHPSAAEPSDERRSPFTHSSAPAPVPEKHVFYNSLMRYEKLPLRFEVCCFPYFAPLSLRRTQPALACGTAQNHSP